MFWTFLDAAALHGERVIIQGAAGHHLARVLRVRNGDEGVAVIDGREYQLSVTEVRGAAITARILGNRPVGNEPRVEVTLLQAVLPNPDFDAVIEAGTAVGIKRFVAVQAARSVARPPSDRVARWTSIAGSAAEQSHRGQIPAVFGPMTLEDALTTHATGSLIVLHPVATLGLAEAMAGSSRYSIAVGPEGGWTEEEIQRMRDRAGLLVHLGPRVLRARLAALVAAAILVQQS